ncbi:hypothetical protein CTAYLR_005033 [Chrysophaeum taylorii]|uniref:Acyltransferase 3 domain-containing protein n=1 Tax=Chrysophaeum taylorii TaxID=2483200 RepID=A0AAD7UAR7_9STRA|nr:hypothetical protein CTAYLR_005033 [Chrysophaeum taylorii]
MGRNNRAFAPFYFLRAYFSVGIVSYHILFALGTWSTNKLAHDPDWAAFVRGRAVPFLCLTGLYAVPVFFMMSGFLTTLPLLEQGAPISAVRLVLSRFVRLAALVLPAILHSLVRYRAYWGFWRFVGWVTLTGNYGTRPVEWMIDPSLVPCWSLAVDFQSSMVLIVVLAALRHRTIALKARAFVVLLVGFTAARALMVLRHPPECSCSIFHFPDWHPINIFMMAPKVTHHFATTVLHYPFHQDYSTQPAPLGCPLAAPDGQHVLVSTYLPTHARITPFFVGAIMACNYHAHRFRSEFMPSKEKKTKRVLPWFALSIIFVHCVLLAPIDVDNLPPKPVVVAFEIFGMTIFSMAVATITYYAILPASHPQHAPRTATFMSSPIFRSIARTSSWLYVLHWPILFEVVRFLPKPRVVSVRIGLSLFAITVALTYPLAAFFASRVEPSLLRFAKSLRHHPSSSCREGGGSRDHGTNDDRRDRIETRTASSTLAQ